MSDEVQLLQRIRANDPAAVGEAYDRFAPKIYAYLYRRTGDRELAEDLTSEVFVRMLDAVQSDRFARTSLAGWLYRIAHNLLVDHFRSQTPSLPLAETMKAPDEDPDVVVERVVDRKQAQDRLRAALRHLTPDQQQVITLRFGQGLSAKQVAEVLGKPETAVWSLQHRALAALRRHLEGEGA